MKSNIDEELNGRSLGWICPKCGRVHAPFIMECFYCNDKLKSEEITHYQNVTSTDEYFQELEKYPTNLDLQESLDGLNKELENLGVQPTSLDELKDIKTIIEDIHRSEEIAQDESNNIPDNDSTIDFLRRVFPNGGIYLNPRKIVKCEHCGAIAYLNKKCPICDKFNGDKSLESDTTYMLEHWVCSRCGKTHLVFPEGGCECGAPLEYLTYVI